MTWRYALSVLCIAAAALLYLSPAGPYLHPTGLFVLGVLAAAWFGGLGPGIFAALLATFVLPQMIEMSYPLVADFFDLPRFITFAVTGAAVGWGSDARRRADAALRAVHAGLESTVEQRTAALRQSEDRYARAMEAAQAGFWDWDVAKDEFHVSPRLLEMSEMPSDSKFAGREDFMRRAPFHPEDREKWQQAVKQLFASGDSRVAMDNRSMRRDGGFAWQRLEGMVFRDKDGKVVRWTGSTTDISERKRAEALLAGEKHLLEMMAHAKPLPEVLDALCRIIEENLSGCLCGIFLVDETGTRLEHGAAPSLPREYVQAIHSRAVVREAGPCGMAAQLREQVIAADVAAETRWVEQGWPALALTHGLRSCWSTPIVSSVQKALGTFAIYFTRPSSPTDEHLAIIERFTHVAAVAIERSHAEQALRANEERYALAMRASGAGHWDWKIPTDEFYASPRYLEFAGFPPDTQYSNRADIVDRIPFHPDDRAPYQAAVAAHLAGETERVDMVVRVVPRGELRWLHVIGMCMRDHDGKPVRWAGSVNDITARELAEEALKLSEERHALALEASEEGHFDNDLETGKIFVSARLNEICGFPRRATVMDRIEFLQRIPFHPDDRHLLAELSKPDGQALTGDFYEIECRIVPRPGEVRWIHSRAKVVRDAKGRPRRRVGVVADITESKRAEEALRLSEERYAYAMEAAQDAHWDWIIGTDQYYTSPRAVDILGFPPGTTFDSREDYLAKTSLLREDVEAWQKAARELFAGIGTRLSMDLRASINGEVRWIQHNGLCVRDASGRAVRWCGSIRDVTEHRRSQEALRQSEERYAVAVDGASQGIFDWDLRNDRVFHSRRAQELLGIEVGESWRTRREWAAMIRYYPDDVSRIRDSIRRSLSGEKPMCADEFRVVPREGEVRWLHQRGVVLRDASGKAYRMAGSIEDITERKRIEQELRSGNEMLELAQRSARAIAFEWKMGKGDGENRWSADLDAMYGFAPGTYDGTYESWKQRVHPEDWARVGEAIKQAQASGDVAFEYRVVHGDGSLHWLQARGRMFFGAAGKPARIVGFMQDITQQKQGELELRQLEQKLRRAQRLEAMGTLAGGIAHDFNNILGAILGYGEMALRDAGKGARLRRDLDAILAAGERGRSLIDRILAFSRSGVGERAPVHVEEVVREALDQLAAKLPANVTIAPRLRAGRAAMMGDSTQVHQVVTNLANNAVQAMPQGGVLRVSLNAMAVPAARPATIGNVAAGEYLVLQVSDTGTGIAPDVFERMFDPFFTTKEVGVGSGLGLSLVHGIVTNVGGAIDVASEAGKGASFTVYLPRTGEAPEKPADENRPLPRGEGQRVLVVDDEEPLVRLATETLERLGYLAVGFTSSNAALAAFRADPAQFDALLTDERMPGMSGTALIREVRGIRETIPVVLMSGYLGITAPDADIVVRKPLSARDLATSMARVLQG